MLERGEKEAESENEEEQLKSSEDEERERRSSVCSETIGMNTEQNEENIDASSKVRPV